MKPVPWIAALVVLASPVAPPTHRQSARTQVSARRDTAPAQARRVAVAPGVELEVLDWGGRGEPLVFLPGLGDTGHGFDDFAPRFRDRYHVYAITPRGFGTSSHPEGGYDSDTRARDVVTVLDALGIRRAVLAGHSIAGDELSRLGAAYPERVQALVYLDAYSYGTDYDTSAFPRVPRARAAFLGAVADSAPAARVLAGTRRADYRRIRAPALAIYARYPSMRQFYPAFDTFDAEDRRRAEVNFAAFRQFQAAQIRRFRAEIRSGEVHEIAGAHHYVFRSDADAVERLMRTFLARPLPRAAA